MTQAPQIPCLTTPAAASLARRAGLGATVLTLAVSVSSCALLQPPERPSAEENITVSSSQAPTYQAQDVPMTEITTALDEPVTDRGLGVTWQLLRPYSDPWGGTVVTILVTNDNEVPLPVDAFSDPVLSTSAGEIPQLPYDPAVNTTVNPPGLDAPLGAGASTNLQYRFNTYLGNLWDARLTLGNITWSGNLNF